MARSYGVRTAFRRLVLCRFVGPGQGGSQFRCSRHRDIKVEKNDRGYDRQARFLFQYCCDQQWSGSWLVSWVYRSLKVI